MADRFQAADGDFADRAVSPKRELGAYEALWAQDGAWFKSIAEKFRAQPGAVPSEFISPSEAEKYARLALGTIRDAGIRHFGIRVHGAGEYPESLRDAEHPVELLYFQGQWEYVSTPCVAIVGIPGRNVSHRPDVHPETGHFRRPTPPPAGRDGVRKLHTRFHRLEGPNSTGCT